MIEKMNLRKRAEAGKHKVSRLEPQPLMPSHDKVFAYNLLSVRQSGLRVNTGQRINVICDLFSFIFAFDNSFFLCQHFERANV